MYYPDEIVEEVRSRNPIVDVIGSYVHLTKKGGNYFGLCPFHNEKTPSFSVSASKQMYHCFGCSKGGNVITFIMEIENMTFPEALKVLADRAGITLPKQVETPEMRRESDLRTRLLEIHKEAAIFFHHMLKSPEGQVAMQYLQRRRISDETIRSFGLGYGTQHGNALYAYLRKKGYNDADLKASGLVTIDERGARDRFWNRVMFPIMDPTNRVIAFGGRVMGDGEPKYLNSPETKIFDKSRNLYGLNVARKTREKFFLVCEGYMDVITMHQAGFTNAVATLGTAFTPQHAMILKRFNKEEVLLCYDSDGAGVKAAMRAIPILREAGLRTKVIDLSPHKDPDEFIKAEGMESFRTRIENAVNGFLFQVNVLRNEYNFADPDDKTAFIRETARRLADFDDPAERNSYVEAVANKFGIDYGILKSKAVEEGNKRAPGSESAYMSAGRPAKTVKKEKTSGTLEAEKLVITALSEDPSLFASIRRYLQPEDFSEGLYRKVAGILFEEMGAGGEVSPAAILNRFVQDETYSEAAALFLSPLSEELDGEELKNALSEAVRKIRLSSVERALEQTADASELMELMKKKQAVRSERIEL